MTAAGRSFYEDRSVFIFCRSRCHRVERGGEVGDEDGQILNLAGNPNGTVKRLQGGKKKINKPSVNDLSVNRVTIMRLSFSIRDRMQYFKIGPWRFEVIACVGGGQWPGRESESNNS